MSKGSEGHDQGRASVGAEPSSATRYGRLALHLVLLGVGLLVVVFAVLELRSRGTTGVSRIGAANYRAVARADSRPAPHFQMPALEGGGKIALQDFAGKVVVLNFWASWCGPCRLEAPDLERTWREFKSRGVQFLGVDYRDDRAAARAFLREFSITYPSVYDSAGTLAFDYELVGVPTTFVIDGTGQIAYQFRGYLNEQVLRRAIEDILMARPS